MNTWIKAEFWFAERAAILVIGKKEMLGNFSDAMAAIKEAVNSGAEEPARLESILLRAIMRLRPDLAGCVIHCFKYELSSQCWEILASHASFPQVQPLDTLLKIPLTGSQPDQPDRPYLATG